MSNFIYPIRNLVNEVTHNHIFASSKDERVYLSKLDIKNIVNYIDIYSLEHLPFILKINIDDEYTSVNHPGMKGDELIRYFIYRYVMGHERLENLLDQLYGLYSIFNEDPGEKKYNMLDLIVNSDDKGNPVSRDLVYRYKNGASYRLTFDPNESLKFTSGGFSDEFLSEANNYNLYIKNISKLEDVNRTLCFFRLKDVVYIFPSLVSNRIKPILDKEAILLKVKFGVTKFLLNQLGLPSDDMVFEVKPLNKHYYIHKECYAKDKEICCKTFFNQTKKDSMPWLSLNTNNKEILDYDFRYLRTGNNDFELRIKLKVEDGTRGPEYEYVEEYLVTGIKYYVSSNGTERYVKVSQEDFNLIIANGYHKQVMFAKNFVNTIGSGCIRELIQCFRYKFFADEDKSGYTCNIFEDKYLYNGKRDYVFNLNYFIEEDGTEFDFDHSIYANNDEPLIPFLGLSMPVRFFVPSKRFEELHNSKEELENSIFKEFENIKKISLEKDEEEYNPFKNSFSAWLDNRY